MKRAFLLSIHALLSLMIVTTLVFSNWTFPAPKAEAGGLDGRATTWWQSIQNVQLQLSATQGTITAANTTVSAGSDTILLTKETLLDGIAWAIAKQMVSSMTRSLINWINSGFQGSPAFITDLKQHLLNAIDTVAGGFIQSLGGIGAFVCSPFKLDVQAALSISYQQARSGMPSGPSACKLSDITDNITNFLDGATDNWQQWFEVTANPQNTPYGAFLEAEAKLNARLVNAQGEEITLANWSDGFLSKKVCEGTGSAQRCTITTPGQVISEALTFQLSTGQMTLIEADEIDEIIGALMNQLMLQVVKGINGLLGLGGNPNYTSYDFDNPTGSSTSSYLDAMIADNLGLTSSTTLNAFQDQIALEQEMLALASSSAAAGTQALASNKVYIGDSGISSSSIVAVVTDANASAATAQANIDTLNNLISRYLAGSSTASVAEAVVNEYVNLLANGTLTTEADLALKDLEWGRIVSPVEIARMPTMFSSLFMLHQHRFFPLLQYLLNPQSGQQLSFSSTGVTGRPAVSAGLRAAVAGGTDDVFRIQQGSASSLYTANCSLYSDTTTSQVVDGTMNIGTNSYVIHTAGSGSFDYTAIGGPRVSKDAIGPSALDLVTYCEHLAENPSMKKISYLYTNSNSVWGYTVSDATCNTINSSELEKKLFLLKASGYEGCRILYNSGISGTAADNFSLSYLTSAAHLLFPGRRWGLTTTDPIDAAYEFLTGGAAALSAGGYSQAAITDCLTEAQAELGFTISSQTETEFINAKCPLKMSSN